MKAEWTNKDVLTQNETMGQSKAILVIDMPKDCASGCRVMCRARGINHRPTWCPLKPLPQRQAKDNSNEVNLGFELGWNACLDEILGGEE